MSGKAQQTSAHSEERSVLKETILSYIIGVILRVWYLFIRVERLEIPPETEALLRQKSGYILAGWHNQILSLTVHVSRYLKKKRKNMTTPLVSRSRDGELIYQTFLRFNMDSVRGSTSRGGAGALRNLLKKMRDGRIPIFTPDGPRGPLYILQPGVIQTAAMTGLPIVFFNSHFNRLHEFRSWDRHKFPAFGARQSIVYSQPFYVPKTLSETETESYRQKLELAMREQRAHVKSFYPETDSQNDDTTGPTEQRVSTL